MHGLRTPPVLLPPVNSHLRHVQAQPLHIVEQHRELAVGRQPHQVPRRGKHHPDSILDVEVETSLCLFLRGGFSPNAVGRAACRYSIEFVMVYAYIMI